jgi:uncharacterized integral membrane protein
MLQLILFLALAFSIVIAVFAVQNPAQVEVSFLFLPPAQLAVSVLVLISAALGAGMMLLLGVAREVQVRLHNRGLAQQVRAAERRVRELEAQRSGERTSLGETVREPTPTGTTGADGPEGGESIVSTP